MNEYKIFEGPKGGKYYLDENGKKHYIHKKKSVRVNTLNY